MSFLDGHEEGCKPLQPCRNCRAVAFLRARLNGDGFEQFLGLLGLEEAVSVVAPVPIETRLETLEAYRDLSVRTQNCLYNDNIRTVEALLNKAEHELLRVPNFGRKSLNEVKQMISRIGHRLGELIPASEDN